MHTLHPDGEVGRFWVAACALAFLSGGLLTLGCDRRDTAQDVSAVGVREEALGSTKQQLAALESTAEQARRDAQQEIEQARANAQEFPIDAREKLDVAIARTERAREHVSERLADLERANDAGWDLSRQRVDEALEELSEARRGMVTAFAASEPARSETS